MNKVCSTAVPSRRVGIKHLPSIISYVLVSLVGGLEHGTG